MRLMRVTSGYKSGHKKAEITAASLDRPEDVDESLGSSIPLTWFNSVSVVLKYKSTMLCIRF